MSVTCIGIAVGIGYYEAAIIATLIVFLILSINHEITGKFERFELIELTITIDKDVAKAIDEIEDYFKKKEIVIKSIKKEVDVIKEKKMEIIKLSISYNGKEITKNEILSKLFSMESVVEVVEE